LPPSGQTFQPLNSNASFSLIIFLFFAHCRRIVSNDPAEFLKNRCKFSIFGFSTIKISTTNK
jgi:hypothetical protein